MTKKRDDQEGRVQPGAVDTGPSMGPGTAGPITSNFFSTKKGKVVIIAIMVIVGAAILGGLLFAL